MNALRRLRMERSITLGALSQKAGINPSTVSEIEMGHRKARGTTLGKLAHALDVPLDDLLDLLDESASERGSKGGRPRKQETEHAQQTDTTPDNQAA